MDRRKLLHAVAAAVKLGDAKWRRKYLLAWAVLMFSLLAWNIALPAHANNATCGFTNGPAERQAVSLSLAFAGAGAIIGLFFPPIGVAAVVVGGGAAIWNGILDANAC